MKLYLRLFWVILTQRWRTRCDILGPVDTKLRVYPGDLDVLLHVNNGVYLTYADLGRTDLLLRSNVLGKIRRKRWYPVAAAATIEFRKSLTLWQTFTIRTHIAGWDDKAIYLNQEFIRNNTTVARAMIDARFLARNGERVSTDDLIRLLGIDHASPELPVALLQWIDSRKRQ